MKSDFNKIKNKIARENGYKTFKEMAFDAYNTGDNYFYVEPLKLIIKKYETELTKKDKEIVILENKLLFG